MSHRRSTTCRSKTTGLPLMEYDTVYSAREGARQAKLEHESEMEPYACHACARWHLAPKERQTPSTPCPDCVGRDGTPKQSYATRASAERRATIRGAEGDVGLEVYPCPHGDGWHLTKGEATAWGFRAGRGRR